MICNVLNLIHIYNNIYNITVIHHLFSLLLLIITKKIRFVGSKCPKNASVKFENKFVGKT